MTKPMGTFHNATTGEVEVRELTEAEIAELKNAEDSSKAETAKLALEEEVKATAKDALLSRLGITADEAKLLLG